jgi:DNA-binding MarR family transcriptional regulator
MMEVSMTQPAPQTEAAELADLLRRLFTVRARFKVALPAQVAQVKERLDVSYPGGKGESSADFELLHQIARILTGPQGSISMGELSRALDVPLSSATRIVDWLEGSGYIERLPDPADRRVVRVALTPDGWAAYRMSMESMCQRIEGWLEHFTPEERLTLLRLNRKLVEILEKEIP